MVPDQSVTYVKGRARFDSAEVCKCMQCENRPLCLTKGAHRIQPASTGSAASTRACTRPAILPYTQSKAFPGRLCLEAVVSAASRPAVCNRTVAPRHMGYPASLQRDTLLPFKLFWDVFEYKRPALFQVYLHARTHTARCRTQPRNSCWLAPASRHIRPY